MRHSFTSFDWVFDRHLEAIVWVTTDDRLYSTCVISWLSDNEREVGFFDLVVMDEFLEFAKSDVIFCDEEEPTRVFVETMDDTWPIFTLFTIKILYLCDELIDESAKTPDIAWRRMRVDTRIFAHHEEIIIFKNYFKRSMVRWES
jgi:hypothetical protein